jgi:hypothetical protein
MNVWLVYQDKAWQVYHVISDLVWMSNWVSLLSCRVYVVGGSVDIAVCWLTHNNRISIATHLCL